MHFAFVLYRYFPHGGLQKDFLRTLHEVLSRGHKVTAYFALQEAELAENTLFRIVRVPVTGCSNHAKMRSFGKAVQRLIKEENFDKVLMFNRLPGGDLYFAADDCLASAYRKKYPAWLLKILPRYRTFLDLEKSVFDNKVSTHILALTDKQIAAYRECYQTSPERFLLMPAGIDENCRRPENYAEIRRNIRLQYNIAEDKIVLIQIAAQFAVKGVDRSIAALASLPGELREKCVLLVAGGGEINKYKEIAIKCNVGDQVIFTGAVSYIDELLTAADLMIHPARKEATGTVIVEALALGVPVIASDICGYAAYCCELDKKLVVPEPFAQTILNETLLAALNDLERLTRLAAGQINNPEFYRRPGAIADILEK